MELTTLLIVCPLVFLAGFVDAIAGGGGLISLPSYLIAGLPPINAVATNKLSSTIGTAAATWRMWKGGYICLRRSAPAAIAAIIGSFIGARLALHAPEELFKVLLIVVLPVAAVFVLRKRTLQNEPDATLPRRKQLIILVAIAFVIGAYDGFYGPGAGTFLLIGFTAFAKLPVLQASGETKVVNLSSNVAALTLFLMNGATWIELGLIAAVFQTLGSYLGAGRIMKDGTRIVRPIIIVVLVLLFVKTVLESTGVLA